MVPVSRRATARVVSRPPSPVGRGGPGRCGYRCLRRGAPGAGAAAGNVGGGGRPGGVLRAVPAAPERHPPPRGCLPGRRWRLSPEVVRKPSCTWPCACFRGSREMCLCFNEGKNLRLLPSTLLVWQFCVGKWCLCRDALYGFMKLCRVQLK